MTVVQVSFIVEGVGGTGEEMFIPFWGLFSPHVDFGASPHVVLAVPLILLFLYPSELFITDPCSVSDFLQSKSQTSMSVLSV